MSRFLGVGETCDLAALYRALDAEGHQVKVHVAHPLAQGTLHGLVEKVDDWRGELDWLAADPDGIVLFEAVSEGLGELQDELRRSGLKVIGGSAFGDRLENDRAFAQSLLRELGLQTAPVWPFDGADEACEFVLARPGRYVLKYSGADHSASDTFVGSAADGRDVLALLRSQVAGGRGGRSLLLMAHLEGVEMGVGAFFNGERFMTPACLDWEHKRFFPGDLGELTGEMGTVVTYERGGVLFERLLRPVEDRLRQAGHVGWVNLNTIVNEDGVWPLEFSCRFGYPGYTILAPLQADGWAALLQAIVHKCESHKTRPGFSVGMVITTPPFPYSREQIDEPVGLPVLIADEADRAHIHFGEVGLDGAGQLATSGLYGWTLVVTGHADSIEAAQRRCIEQAATISVPNARYRLDIGNRLIDGDWRRLENLGLLDPVDFPAHRSLRSP